MQQQNGDMVEIQEKEFLELERKRKLLAQELERQRKILSQKSEGKGRAQPTLKPNAVFKVGEILEIKYGRFMVQSIEKSGMYLKSMPKIDDVQQ